MKERLLMVVHDRASSTGRIGARLEARGFALDVRCPVHGAALPSSLDEHAGVVVFGGAMSANDDGTNSGIRAELDWIPVALDAGVPFLGVCLGAQLLARVLGAAVAPHPEGLAEIGYFPLRPTEAGRAVFDGPLMVYHWHKEGFDLPSDATLLAIGERFPNQAYRYGDAAYGIQFHPEVTLELMRSWLADAPPSLALPGAQGEKAQLEGHARFDTGLDAWVERFLDVWLAGGKRWARETHSAGGRR